MVWEGTGWPMSMEDVMKRMCFPFDMSEAIPTEAYINIFQRLRIRLLKRYDDLVLEMAITC
jgi:hypothetical protein